jgi:pimeloyl-ACP methyl ester carboxylesterase
MAPNEVRALGELAAETLDVTITTPVEGVHEAVATRVFGAIGPSSEPARLLHDGIASSLYRGLRRAGAAAGTAAGAAAEAISGTSDIRVLGRSRRGRFAQAAINALVGDRLEEQTSDIRIELAVRDRGRDVPLAAGALASAFPEATPKIAIFIHGLGEDESAWHMRASAQGGATYGSRLHDDLGFTPVLVRYNTGLHISENGRRLASLIDRLADHWPAPVGEIVLVGHSMGGLVARSACHRAALSGLDWLGAVRHVVFLGSPHLGAPLEKLVNVGSWGLAIAAESRPFAGVLNTRSVGIKDLRFGYVTDEDWQGAEPDRLLRNSRRPLPPPDWPAFHHVAATLTADHRHPLAVLAGDLLVRHASATGRGIAAERITTRHFGRRTHFDLLNDPEVYAHMRDCLTRTFAR